MSGWINPIFDKNNIMGIKEYAIAALGCKTDAIIITSLFFFIN